MQIIAAIAVAAVLVGLNVVLRIENQKTPVPEGCEELMPDCTSCGIADCTMRRARKEEENGNS